jgi:hypothetical protein
MAKTGRFWGWKIEGIGVILKEMMIFAYFSNLYLFYGEGTAGCSRNNQGPVKTIGDVPWSTLTLLIGNMQLLQFIQA